MQSNVSGEDRSLSSQSRNTNNNTENNKQRKQKFTNDESRIRAAISERIRQNMKLKIPMNGREYMIEADLLLCEPAKSDVSRYNVNFRIANLAEMFFGEGLPKCSTSKVVLVHFIDSADLGHALPDCVWEHDGEYIKQLYENSQSGLGSSFCIHYKDEAGIRGHYIRILYSSALSGITKGTLSNREGNPAPILERVCKEIFSLVLNDINREVLPVPSPFELFMPSVLMDVEMDNGTKVDAQVDSSRGMLSALWDLQLRRSCIKEFKRMKSFKICSVGQAETERYLSTMKGQFANFRQSSQTIDHSAVDGADPTTVTTPDKKMQGPFRTFAVPTAELVPGPCRGEETASSSAVLTHREQPSSTVSMDNSVSVEMVNIAVSVLANLMENRLDQQKKGGGNLQR